MYFKLARMILKGGLILTALLSVAVASAAPPKANEPAPDFALKTFSGVNMRLSEMRGDVVLLNFWASWCRSCRSEIPRIAELIGSLERDDLHVVGVTIDEDTAQARRASQELGVNYPTLMDDTNRIAKLYDLPTLPVTVLIDRHGVLRYFHAGYENGDEALYLQEVNALLAE